MTLQYAAKHWLEVRGFLEDGKLRCCKKGTENILMQNIAQTYFTAFVMQIWNKNLKVTGFTIKARRVTVKGSKRVAGIVTLVANNYQPRTEMMTVVVMQPHSAKRLKSHWSSSHHSGIIGWIKPARVQRLWAVWLKAESRSTHYNLQVWPSVWLLVLQRQQLWGPTVELNWCVKQHVMNKNKKDTSVGGWLCVCCLAGKLGSPCHASIQKRRRQRTGNLYESSYYSWICDVFVHR